MSKTVIRPFQPSDGDDVQFRLRVAWRMEIPKKFNLTQVIAEQPVGHVIVAACVAIFYIFVREISMLCLAIPGFYIALYMVVLIVFLIQADDLLLRELADIPSSYMSAESGHFWVAEAEGPEGKELIGTVGLLRKTADLAQIRHLTVMKRQEPDCPITRQLLIRSLSFAKNKGFTKVELLTTAVDLELAKVFDQVGFQLKERFYMPSKHLYILPMQVLHVRLDQAKVDVSNEPKTD